MITIFTLDTDDNTDKIPAQIMRRHTIGTRFPENQIAVVDRIATSMSKRHRLEVSRSDIVRMCVERVLPKFEAEHLSRGR